ncbi:DBF4-type zinc finger-containing protein 2 homolog [Zingiber officinale]|uniref:DBF4-type zinc finger-containing protein 2 homolog n=1 Tax=Zingiber officinale TaxID=94328 RepID=UPI001C4DD11C|nr:DBF4-type zinc finger-containing protein 2 homolog [Zingiber officinale]
MKFSLAELPLPRAPFPLSIPHPFPFFIVPPPTLLPPSRARTRRRRCAPCHRRSLVDQQQPSPPLASLLSRATAEPSSLSLRCHFSPQSLTSRRRLPSFTGSLPPQAMVTGSLPRASTATTAGLPSLSCALTVPAFDSRRPRRRNGFA